MMKNDIRSFFLLCLFFIFSHRAHAEELKSIDFFQDGDVSKLEFTFDKESVKGERFHNVNDKQIIIELKNVTAVPKILRAFDTSEFKGSIVMVSPYRLPGKEENLRIVVQLRDNVRSVFDKIGNKMVLSVENRFGVFDLREVKKDEKNELAIAKGEDTELVSKLLVPKSDSVQDILDNLVLSGPKKYIGKKISINVKDIHITALLKMLADSTGFNLVVGEEVNTVPKLTLVLTNIPWDQALDTVLDLGGLVAKRSGNILSITTLAKATADKKSELDSKNMAKKEEPLVTKIFPISYADIADLQGLLGQYLTKERGAISVDKRTNSLIVKDTVEVIEKLKKIIDVLDTQTPQILIEAKIVEMTEKHSMEFGLKRGVSFGYDPLTQVGNTTQAGPAAGTPFGSFSFSSAPNLGDRTFMGFSVFQFHRLLNLDLDLQLMESESKAKIISSPRIIAKNKEAATITNDETTSYVVTTTSNGQQTSSYQETSATMNLTVTPLVTNEGSIAMDISLSKSSFLDRTNESTPPNKSARSLKTSVLVDNGSTIVLGGIYNYQDSIEHSGIPFLKDIPILGWLFRTSYAPSKQKNELIIFITPRIINQEESGLATQNGSMG